MITRAKEIRAGRFSTQLIALAWLNMPFFGLRGICAKVCPVDIVPVTEMNGAECIRCYECTTTKHIAMGAK